MYVSDIIYILFNCVSLPLLSYLWSCNCSFISYILSFVNMIIILEWYHFRYYRFTILFCVCADLDALPIVSVKLSSFILVWPGLWQEGLIRNCPISICLRHCDWCICLHAIGWHLRSKTSPSCLPMADWNTRSVCRPLSGLLRIGCDTVLHRLCANSTLHKGFIHHFELNLKGFGQAHLFFRMQRWSKHLEGGLSMKVLSEEILKNELPNQ